MPTGDESSIYGPAGSGVEMPLLPYRNYLSDLYGFALQSVYQGYRVWDPSYADSRDPDLWEKARRDPIVAHACEQRMHSVAARFWRVEAGGDDDASDEAAQIVEEMLNGIERFAQSRYELAGAVITARAFGYVSGERGFRAVNGKVANWWTPVRVQDIDRRRFHYAPEWGEDEQGRRTLKTKLKVWSVPQNGWVPVKTLRCLIRHVYNDEEARLGYGRGLLEAIYFYMYAKQIVMREGLKGLAKWAQGGFAAGVDGLRAASTGKPNDTVAKAWRDAWKAWSSEHILVHDKVDEITAIPGPGQGHEMVAEWRRYLDDAITRLILGSILPSGGGSPNAGSMARAETESDTTEQLIQYDRLLLDETLTRDLIGSIWVHNRRQFNEAGLGSAKMPKFSSVQEKKSDPKEAAQVVATLHAAGINLREDEVYERTGFTVPIEGDKIIEGAASAGRPNFSGLPPGMKRDIGAVGGGAESTPGTPDAMATRPLLGGVDEGDQDVRITEEKVLNGAQIQAAEDIVKGCAAGEIPRDSALGMLMLLFNLDEPSAKTILGSAGTGSTTMPDKPDEPVEAEPMEIEA